MTQLNTGSVVDLDSATGHKHPHIEILDGTGGVLGHVPMHALVGADGWVYQAATEVLQQQLLAELKLANAPSGYRKNNLGEVTQVLRLVNGVVQTHALTKTIDGTDTIYSPGEWA